MVVYQGLSGSFQHLATKKLFPNDSLTCVPRFVDVFMSLQNPEIDFGVIAIENSLAGPVSENLQHLNSFSVQIVGEEISKIDHYLLGIGSIDTIKQVHAHPMALLQCEKYLESKSFQKMESSNNAVAAKLISEIQDPTQACIASIEASKIYNLKVLDSKIQDNSENYTRMLVLKKGNFEVDKFLVDSESDIKNFKISLVFSLEHTKGSLAHFLSEITDLGINLTLIQSKPIAEQPFEYSFFIDGLLETNLLTRFFKELFKSRFAKSIKILGCFPSALL